MKNRKRKINIESVLDRWDEPKPHSNDHYIVESLLYFGTKDRGEALIDDMKNYPENYKFKLDELLAFIDDVSGWKRSFLDFNPIASQNHQKLLKLLYIDAALSCEYVAMMYSHNGFVGDLNVREVMLELGVTSDDDMEDFYNFIDEQWISCDPFDMLQINPICLNPKEDRPHD